MRCNIKVKELPRKCPKCGNKIKKEKFKCGHCVTQKKLMKKKLGSREYLMVRAGGKGELIW